MAPPTIANGRVQFQSRGKGPLTGFLMIHAMAQYIWYEGKMYHYDELLTKLSRGVHFAILPDGQIIKHASMDHMMWHAKGFNDKSWGVELIVPGVYDLGALYKKINRKCMAYDVYTREQYDGLLLLLAYMSRGGYISNPTTDWELHQHCSQGRKKDPGIAFDAKTLWQRAIATHGA